MPFLRLIFSLNTKGRLYRMLQCWVFNHCCLSHQFFPPTAPPFRGCFNTSLLGWLFSLPKIQEKPLTEEHVFVACVVWTWIHITDNNSLYAPRGSNTHLTASTENMRKEQQKNKQSCSDSSGSDQLNVSTCSWEILSLCELWKSRFWAVSTILDAVSGVLHSKQRQPVPVKNKQINITF